MYFKDDDEIDDVYCVTKISTNKRETNVDYRQVTDG